MKKTQTKTMTQTVRTWMPAGALFALCMYLYCISGVAMAQNYDPYFYVDIHNNSAASGDVITAGQPTFSWIDNQAYQYTGMPLPTFYAYLNGSIYPDLAYTASALLGSPVQFEITPNAFTAYKWDNDTFTNYTAFTLTQTRCTDETGGRHLVTIQFHSTLHLSPSNFTFYRWCKAPTMNIGSAAGLKDIYTANQTLSVPFSTDNNNVSATMYLWASQFEPYWVNGNPIEYTITAFGNDNTMADPSVDTDNSALTVGENGYVVVYYAYGCLPGAVGNVTFSMQVSYGFVQNLTMSWWKVCGPVDDSSPPPVNVYSCAAKDSTCMVADRANGTFPNWGTGTGYAYYQQPQRFTLYLDYVFPTGPAVLECRVSAADQTPAIAYTINKPGDVLNLRVGIPYPLPLYPVCIAPNFAQFQVAINCNTTVSGRPTNYTPIVVYYNFQCVKPLVDLSTMLGGTPTLVSKSNPQNGVNGEPGNIFNPQIIVDGTYIEFFATLNTDTPQNFSALYVSLAATIVPGGMTVNIDTSQISTGTLSSTTGSILTIPVRFVCNSPGIVAFELSVGWLPATTFYVETNCAGDSGSGGLNGASIFFIVFFVLLFVFCVAGSLFNYYNRGKRGWPIIPGYDTCQGCYDKAMGPNRYTPQMDYERTFKTGGGGYGSYGTTSGDSYQSNL